MPAAMAAAMDEGLDEIKHESVDLVRIDPICVFLVRLLRFPLPIDLSIWFAVLFLVSSASFEVLRSAFSCVLFVSI